MKKHLEFKDEKSHKFWQIVQAENELTVTYGKIGTNGQSKTKTFNDAEKALKEANKLIGQKTKKGYKETDTAAKSDPPEQLSPIASINYYEELKKFDAAYGGESYAQSFWIEEEEDDFFESWLYDISDEKKKAYAKPLQVFAGADGTGARYVFWFQDEKRDVNQSPIICYGSEGEIHIIASDIKDLIKILSFGQEASDGGFYFGMYDIDDFETEEEFFEDELKYRPNFHTFRQWMKEKLQITPVKDWKVEDNTEVNKLVKKAVKKYQKAFDKWQYQFYPDPKDEDTIREAQQQKLYKDTKKDLLQRVKEEPTAELYLQLSKNEMIVEEPNRDRRDEFIELALEVDPNHIEALEVLGERKLADPAKGIRAYVKLIEIHPKPKKYFSNLAYSYMRLKTKEGNKEAIDWYIKDIIANPNGYGVYSQEYILKMAKDSKLNGITIIQDILNKVEDKGCHLVLYKHWFKKKKFTESLSHLMPYIKLEKSDFGNCMDFGRKYFEKKAFDEALVVFDYAITFLTSFYDYRKADCHNYIGVILDKKGNYKDALSHFMKAKALDPEQELYKNNIAYIKEKLPKKGLLNKFFKKD